MKDSTVIVVGGGIVGACCAYFLRKSGWMVTIADQGRFAAGCSHGSCGLISPSHALPLAVPGILADTMRVAFKPDAPFRVAPRFDPGLWAWLLKFAARCKEAPMLASAVGRHALQDSDSTRQGLLDHLRSPESLSDDADGIRGRARRGDALRLRLSTRFHHGVRGLRFVAESPSSGCAQAGGGDVPARAVRRAGRGRVVRMAADDLRRPARHRSEPGPR